MPPGELAEALSRALRRRLTEIEAADERQRRFVVEPGEAAPEDASDAVDDVSPVRDLVLRALACASDPINYAILTELAGGDVALADVARSVGIPRIAVAERVNDLMQVGLAGRSLRGDAAGTTEAGRAVVDLVEAVAVESDAQPAPG